MTMKSNMFLKNIPFLEDFDFSVHPKNCTCSYCRDLKTGIHFAKNKKENSWIIFRFLNIYIKTTYRTRYKVLEKIESIYN